MNDSKDIRKTVIEDINKLISDLVKLRDDLEKFFKNMQMSKEPISERQKSYLMILYKKLNRKPPDNLDKLSKDDANKLINDLKRELGW